MASPVQNDPVTKERRTSDAPSTTTHITSSPSFLPPPPPPAPAPAPPAPPHLSVPPLPMPSSPLRSMTLNSTPFSYTTSLSPVKSPLRESLRETSMAKKVKHKIIK